MDRKDKLLGAGLQKTQMPWTASDPLTSSCLGKLLPLSRHILGQLDPQSSSVTA